MPVEIKFKLGDKFRTRNGQTATVESATGNTTYPWYARCEDGERRPITKFGRNNDSTHSSSDTDWDYVGPLETLADLDFEVREGGVWVYKPKAMLRKRPKDASDYPVPALIHAIKDAALIPAGSPYFPVLLLTSRLEDPKTMFVIGDTGIRVGRFRNTVSDGLKDDIKRSFVFNDHDYAVAFAEQLRELVATTADTLQNQYAECKAALEPSE